MKSKLPPGPRSPRRCVPWRIALRLPIVCCVCLNADPSHVVVVGVDGLSPDGIHKAATPHLDDLMRNGAHSFRARAVMPTSSSPNWASMIMGAGPEQHGITSNEWQPDRHDIVPTATGRGGIFPTIFAVLHEQQPQSVTACFYDWDGFGRLLEPKALNHLQDAEGPTNAVRQAVACFLAHKPTLIFIHLDHVDHAGHEFGHGSTQYYASVEVADQLIGETISGLKTAQMWDQTLIIVTSDHGGVGKGHGGATMPEIEIPWIIHGPGIIRGHLLKSPINVYDTAATIAAALHLRPPECWIARPVLEAFSHPPFFPQADR